MENKIRRFGNGAEKIALELLDRCDGIPDISDAEFDRILKGGSYSRNPNSDFEAYKINSRQN